MAVTTVGVVVVVVVDRRDDDDYLYLAHIEYAQWLFLYWSLQFSLISNTCHTTNRALANTFVSETCALC
jgi:hypothetical protein